MNEPYTDKELRRIQREDNRSPTTLRFLATIARLQADLAELRQVGIESYNNQIAVLQARVEELEFWWNTTERERDRYKAVAERQKEVLERHFPESLGHRADGERDCHYCRSLVSLDPHKPECPRAAIEEEGKR